MPSGASTAPSTSQISLNFAVMPVRLKPGWIKSTGMLCFFSSAKTAQFAVSRIELSKEESTLGGWGQAVVHKPRVYSEMIDANPTKKLILKHGK